MNILIGIWKNENGSLYYKCTNCGIRSQPSTELSVIRSKILLHRSECKKPEKWTDVHVDGKPQSLIGVEVISL